MQIRELDQNVNVDLDPVITSIIKFQSINDVYLCALTSIFIIKIREMVNFHNTTEYNMY